MPRPRLLIVNGSLEFCRNMANVFRDFADTEYCHSGRRTLELLRADRHELMLLDLSIPDLDGLTVLNMAQAEGILPATLVTMDMQSQYIATALTQLQISYAMVKPCATEAILANMQGIAAHACGITELPVRKAEDAVSEMLLKLHFNPKHGGYAYLKAAIPMYAKNPGQFITKELYTEIGKAFGKNGLLIERSMRAAIEKAWETDDSGIWQTYFPGMIGRPANKVFIAAMSQLIFPYVRRQSAG